MIDLIGAIRDLVMNVARSGGAETLESLDDELDAIIDIARSPQSGSTLLTGPANEDILYEESDTHPWYFDGAWVDLGNEAADDTVRFRLYVKEESGGAYIRVSDDAVFTYAGVQDPQKVRVAGGWYNQYGVKLTCEHTVVGVGGAIIVKAEIFDGKRGS